MSPQFETTDKARSDIVLEPVTRRRVPEMVEIHKRALPGFFLTFLGQGFLTELYNAFCNPEEGIGFVAIDQSSDRVIGLVAGPLVPAGHFKRLVRRRWWAFCMHSVKAILRRPAIIPRLFRAFRYRGDAPPGADRALLSSIAVAPAIQQGGIGRRLADAFVDEARKRGASGVYLTTDRDGNDGVNAFYQRLGWRLEGFFVTPEGRHMNRYVWDFEKPQAEALTPNEGEAAAS